MKFFRYRRPSWKTVLGVTRAKKRLKKQLGMTALLKPLRWWPNEKRKLKREIGYESPAGRVVRDGLPKPAGCLVLLAAWCVSGIVAAAAAANLWTVFNV